MGRALARARRTDRRSGEGYFCQDVADAIVTDHRDGWEKLTRAERETVALAAKGLSNQGIAERRGTALRTIANQLTAAYKKLQIASRRELLALLRWSCVNRFERDGKHYYLALRSAPDVAIDRALTLRERQVLAYVELGHSNKLIAYSLGVAISTVATLLARARRKLRSHEH